MDPNQINKMVHYIYTFFEINTISNELYNILYITLNDKFSINI